MKKRIILVLVAVCAIGIYKTKTGAGRAPGISPLKTKQAIDQAKNAIQALQTGLVTDDKLANAQALIDQAMTGAPKQAQPLIAQLLEIRSRSQDQKLRKELDEISQVAAQTSSLKKDIKDKEDYANFLFEQLASAQSRNDANGMAQVEAILKEQLNTYHNGVAILLDTLLVNSDDPNIDFNGEIARAVKQISDVLNIAGIKKDIASGDAVAKAIKSGQSIDKGVLERLYLTFDANTNRITNLEETLKAQAKAFAEQQAESEKVNGLIEQAEELQKENKALKDNFAQLQEVYTKMGKENAQEVRNLETKLNDLAGKLVKANANAGQTNQTALDEAYQMAGEYQKELEELQEYVRELPDGENILKRFSTRTQAAQ